MRKRLTSVLLAVMTIVFIACQDKTCHISGTIPEKYNGKKIFLVPTTNDNRFNVDSVVIENGKFEFSSDTMMLAEIRVDYHYRMGLQPLLVVVEPGEVRVRVDSISSAVGTLQNDSLDKWKQQKQKHDFQYMHLKMLVQNLNKEGDTIQANKYKAMAYDYHLNFKNYTRQLAGNLPEGILRDFLSALYPKTYQRLMPDSTTVTFDADTNEPIDN